MKQKVLVLVAIVGLLNACASKEEEATSTVSVGEQIISDINQRYTAKAYDNTKRVSAEDLKVIEEVLRLSPSSINSQPWKFIVIRSDEAKQRLSKTFENYKFNQPHATKASEIILFANKVHFGKEDYKKRLDASLKAGRTNEKGYEQMLTRAFKFAENAADENGDNSNWTKAQTYIALGNVLHAKAYVAPSSSSFLVQSCNSKFNLSDFIFPANNNPHKIRIELLGIPFGLFERILFNSSISLFACRLAKYFNRSFIKNLNFLLI